jgi:ribosome modulation factor
MKILDVQFREGMNAYMHGISIDKCPYVGDWAKAWRKGWHHKRRMAFMV